MTDGRDAGELTQLLERANAGDDAAVHRLFNLAYAELHRIAVHKMRSEPSDRTIQATALVSEVWVKMFGKGQSSALRTRAGFMVAASEAMRRILVDAARARNAAKRGAARRAPAELDVDQVVQLPHDEDLLALEEALEDFERVHPERATLVKLRYFSGMTIDEVSREMGISTATVERHWAFARAWLRRRIDER